MRKLTFLVLVAAISIFSVIPSFAEVKMERPDLPSGYETWPFVYKNTCPVTGGVMTIAIYGLVNKDEKTFQHVTSAAISGETPLFYVHGIAVKGSSYTYLMVYHSDDGKEWVKLDFLDEEDQGIAAWHVNFIDGAMKEFCPAVDAETDKFFEELRSQIERE